MKNQSYFIWFLTLLMVSYGQTEQNAWIVTKSEFFINSNADSKKKRISIIHSSEFGQTVRQVLTERQ